MKTAVPSDGCYADNSQFVVSPGDGIQKNVLKRVNRAAATHFNRFYVSDAGLQPAAMAVCVLRVSVAVFLDTKLRRMIGFVTIAVRFSAGMLVG